MITAVIGSGGREHALVWRLATSPLVERVLAIPGNPGTAAERGVVNVPCAADDGAGIVSACLSAGVSLAIVGPEAALMAGVADHLRAAGIDVVGPGATGALLEGSKAFAKEVMAAAGVPTAVGAQVASVAEVDAFIASFEGDALVVKADGLAAGKGVVVCDTVAQAREVAVDMLERRPYGEACARLVLEERLDGIETSYIVLTDGLGFAALPTSQDHKRLQDGDVGPNTGGMGAITPAPFVDEQLREEIERTIIQPTLLELRRRSIPFRGFLYAGLMLTSRGPRVLEFNTRLGDPETQVLLAALQEDPVPLLHSAARGALQSASFGPTRAAAVVVLAAEGYPTAPRKGDAIEGIEAAERHPDVKVFHAGTAMREQTLVTAGGRVLGVTAMGSSPGQAVERAYAAAGEIRWPGITLRRDIGHHLG